MSKQGSKKDRKALKRREAELAAELAAREAKAAKKAAKKKRKQVESGEAPIDHPLTKAERDAMSPAAALRAEVAAAVDEAGSPDEAIRLRVTAKKAAREALDALDRTDHEAVRAFNEVHGQVIGHFATSTAELEAVSKWLHGEDKEPVATDSDKAFRADQTFDTDDALVETPVPQVADEVETETGRVFEVGPGDSDATPEFAKPSDAAPEVELNGLGQYKVKRPGDGKFVGYTRVTTFIDVIDDKANLEKWKLRTLLEGIEADAQRVVAEDGAPGIPLRISTFADIVHRRDVAIAKARKADRKGKLEVGELADLIEDATKLYKRDADRIVTELLEEGKVHEKATKGTEIHELCELYDAEGIDAVGEKLTAGEITPADLADVEAYAAAMDRAGVKVLESETFVVDDEAKKAGRLDRIVMAKLPGAARATRLVADIKTGRVDYAPGKIAMQVENYAGMKAYDPANPDERRDLKASRTKGLLIHLPAGKAECHIYVVDLSNGRIGNRIATDVRQHRNVGKKAIDFSVDLAAPAAS